MTAPASNLPPDSQAWGDSVEKRFAELNKRIGVAASAAKAANVRTAGAARSAAEASERAAQLEHSQTAIVQEVIDKNESTWAAAEPANPQHNHHWHDIADGNVLKIRADYGAYERINYVRNPAFRFGTQGWSAGVGTLTHDSSGRGHISAPADGAAAIVETQGRAVVIDLPATEDDGSGEGASPAGQVGALWTASAELELVESSMYVTATLEVIDSNDVPVATSGPVRLEYGAPTRITARPQEGIEGTMDSVRVALSLVNEEEPNFEVTVDEVILEAADYGDDEEQQYFDGSMPGVLWQGADSYSSSWWDGEPRWIEAMDLKALRQSAQDAFVQLGLAFATSETAPTPADGADRPDNAVWTQVNADGEQVARWRWVLADQEWVTEPLGVEIIPEAYIDYLVTNEAFMSQLVLSEEADGWLTRVTGRGVEIFDPDDMPVSRYGSFSENALNFYSGGEPVASIADTGVVLGKEGAFDVLEVGGTDIREFFNEGPRGVIYDRNFPLSRRITTLGGHSYIVFDAYQGRQYKVTCRVTLRNMDSEGARVTFYHTSANLGQPLPGEPSVIGGNNSSQTAQNRSWWLAPTSHGPQWSSHEISFTYTAPGTVDKTVALLNGFEPFNSIGNGQLEIGSSWWTVEDIGRTGTGSGGSYSISGGGSSGGGSNPEPEQPKRRYTRRYNSTEWRTFQNVTGDNSGSRTTAVSGPTQGYTPYYPSAGQYASHYYFNSGEIQADTAGATIISARVRVTCTHSHANGGGTARLHLHGHGPSGNWGSPSHVGDSHFAKGQSKWLGVTSQGWRTGGVRGIGFWSRGNSTNYYMRFGTTAVLEIVYER